MTVEIKPETERLAREEIDRGVVCSVDELIVYAVQSLREKHPVEVAGGGPRKSLYELLSQPPFAGSGLEIERTRDMPRDIEL